MSIKQKLMLCLIIMLIIPLVLIVLLALIMGAALVLFHPAVELSLTGGIEISDPVTVKFLIAWAIAAVCIIISGVVAVTAYLSHSILKPIKELTVAMERLKNGDLSYEFSGSGDKEIHALCGAYDSLRLHLQTAAAENLEYEHEQKMLIANLSHDIKTPITSIIGYVEGIRDGIADTPEKLEKYLNTIHAKADSIELMAENLSLYAKLEARRLSYTTQPLDLFAFVRDTVSDFELDLQQNDIEALFILPNEQCMVKGDKEKLKRVFANIITNAIKYKSKNIGRLRIRGEQTAHGALVTFEDNGKGIAEKDLKHIFESFYRGDSSRNSKIGGSGLGLSICKKIIEDHGGKIWIRSNENTGTSVMVLLPCIKTEDTGYEHSDY